MNGPGYNVSSGHPVTRRLTTIVFDLDGTLYVNLELGREINRVASDYVAELRGGSAAEAATLVRDAKARLTAESGFDTPLSLAVASLGGTHGELHRRFAELVRPERYLSRDDRVVELVHRLADCFELYIYTNNNRLLTHSILDLLGIAGHFREIFSIEYSWNPKPHQATLEQLLGRIGRDPGETLFVGDRYDVDLRLPALLGCGIFHVGGIEELLQLSRLINEENL